MNIHFYFTTTETAKKNIQRNEARIKCAIFAKITKNDAMLSDLATKCLARFG